MATLSQRVRWLLTGQGIKRPAVRSYAAARMSRLEGDWWASLLSADQEVKGNLRTLRARSRQLVRDNAYAAGYVRLVQNNLIGPQGVILHSRIMTARGAINKALNDGIETAWYEWGQDPAQVTADGRMTWQELEELAVATVVVDGEAFLRKRMLQVDGRKVFALQWVDADQVDETYERRAGAGENEIRMGVEVNGDGRPVAYYIIRGHPAEAGGVRERIRVPADEILHLYEARRPGQSRGLPWLTPCMLALKMLDGYQEAELVAARVSAAKAIYYEQAQDVGDPVEGGEIVEDIEPGVGRLLPPGVTAKMLDPTHPTSTFPEFSKSILRAIASGLGVSYHTLTGDLEAVNFSSARAGLLQERDHWKARQAWLIARLHRPVFRAWLRVAAVNGTVKLPTPEPDRWRADVWQPRRWAWVDPMKDVQAATLALSAQLVTRSEICQEQGRDFEDVLAGLEREDGLAAGYGIELTNGNAPGGADGGTGDAEDAASADDGDGGEPEGRGRIGLPYPDRHLVRIAG